MRRESVKKYPYSFTDFKKTKTTITFESLLHSHDVPTIRKREREFKDESVHLSFSIRKSSRSMRRRFKPAMTIYAQTTPFLYSITYLTSCCFSITSLALISVSPVHATVSVKSTGVSVGDMFAFQSVNRCDGKGDCDEGDS